MAGSEGNLIRLGLDWETFYSKDYTLSDMMTPEYVMDSRFEAIILGLTVHGALPVWYSGDEDYFRKLLHTLPWHRIEVICHNAIFDGSILEWRFGVRPARYMCTMMGSRPYIAPYTGSMSLASCLDYTGLGVKGQAVHQFKGYRRKDFSRNELVEYGEYCCNDSLRTVQLDKWIMTQMPQEERDMIDLTIKKFVRPRVKVSVPVIDARLADIQVEKDTLAAGLLKRGYDPSQIRSRNQFAAILESKGVVVPMKLSKKKAASGVQMSTFAMAKQDDAFMALLDHDDAIVRELVEARLTLASNQEEMRLLRMRAIGELNLEHDSLLPVPLLYYGAHTGRLSGLDSINLQNLSRHKYDKVTGKIAKRSAMRDALVAPEGYSIVAADLSNIEARLVATLAGQFDMVKDFANGIDLYAKFAGRIYNRLIDKKNDPDERFVGKTCILGLGYGMGAPKFYKQMVIAKAAGVPDQQSANRIVYLYRDVYKYVPEYWSTIEDYMKKAVDKTCLMTLGPLTILHERIMLPNGMPLLYPGLRFSNSSNGLVYTNHRGRASFETKIWGGAFTENICQALARIIISRAEIRLAKAGLQSVLQVHDELVYLVRNEFVDRVKKAVHLAMTAPVDFLPRLPVAAELGSGPSYGEAK